MPSYGLMVEHESDASKCWRPAHAQRRHAPRQVTSVEAFFPWSYSLLPRW